MAAVGVLDCSPASWKGAISRSSKQGMRCHHNACGAVANTMGRVVDATAGTVCAQHVLQTLCDTNSASQVASALRRNTSHCAASDAKQREG